MKFQFRNTGLALLTESLIYEHCLGSKRTKDFLDEVRDSDISKYLNKETINEYLDELLEAGMCALKDDEIELIKEFRGR